MKGIYQEFQQLFKEHKLLVAVVAVIAVPLLYAGMFLWAFWDPYDHLADLPIAVVDEDEGIVEDGEQLTLGQDLVDKLKEDPVFDFHFVEKAVAEKGLEAEDYYIMIEIPKNFSKNATTLMDDPPEKLDLIYIPNESYNFLASQIGETAMLEIEKALQEKITETYAETIFEKISEVADGLDEASEASDALHDGATTLQDGSKTLHENLQTFMEKSQTFTDGMHDAKDGASDLNDGSQTLADGMGKLETGSNDLLDAAKQVREGTVDLQTGISSAKDGLDTIDEKIPDLIKGTNDLYDGVAEMQTALPEQLAEAISEKISSSSSLVGDGLTTLQTSITNGLTEELAPGMSEEIANNIAKKLVKAEQEKGAQLAKLLMANDIDPVIVEGITKQLQANAQTEEQVAAQLKKQLAPGIETAMKQSAQGIENGFDTFQKELVKNISGGTDGLEKEIKKAVDPSFETLKTGISTLNEGQTTLADGATKLADGATKLADGADALVEGQTSYVENIALFSEKFGEANDGLHTLTEGTNGLLSGLIQLEDGFLQLAGSSTKLATGSGELDEGLFTLTDGTETFKNEMNDAAKEANDIETDENTYQMMAAPVDVKNEKINEVPNYGTGFAPYFLSLGLFVGALLLSIVYPLRETSEVPKSGFYWFFSKFTVLFLIGILQAIIVSAVLLLGLKIEVQSVPLFILFSIITSLVFITLIQFLVTCLDDPGRFIAIIILILQLTTSAGTFPLELIPKLLQPVSALLPMTYSVAGYKAVISSGDLSVMWQNAGILLGFSIVFISLTMSYFIVMYKRKYGNLETNEAVTEKA